MRYFGPLSHALVDWHLERGVTPLHDAVGVDCERAQLLKTKAQVPGMRLRDDCYWFLVDDCLGVI